MAISIVSNPNPQDNEDTTTSWQSTQQPDNDTVAADFSDDKNIQENTQANTTQDATNNKENNPEAIQWEESIPNLYMQADQKQSENTATGDSASANAARQDDGFDMDDLLDDNDAPQEDISSKQEVTHETQDPVQSVTNEEPSPSTEQSDVDVADLFSNTDATESPAQTTETSSQQKTQTTEDNKNNNNTTQTSTQDKPVYEQKATAKQTQPGNNTLIKWLVFAAAGCAGILVLWFVIKTMFPLGMSTQQPPTQDVLVATGTIVEDEQTEENTDWEHSADTRTEQEIVLEELKEYSSLWTSFYEMGRDLKDRNMVRYALYVEKKSQDLVDELASNPDMDTKDVVVYFAQFDDYLQELEKLAIKKTNTSTTNSNQTETNTINNNTTPARFDPINEQNDAPTDNESDTNTGSELSELSDW